MRVGLRFIRGSRIMWPALGATATVNLFGFVLSALFILYATRSLGVTPAILGLVLGAAALGGLLGSIVTGRVARRIGVGPAFVVGCLVFPAFSLLIPLAGGPHPLVLATLFLAEVGSGIGVILLDINLASIFAAHIPPELRARVSGAYTTINYGVRPVGSLLGGALGTLIGVRPTLWPAAAGGLAEILWLIGSPPGPRRVTARRPYLLMPWLEIWVRLADEKCRHAASFGWSTRQRPHTSTTASVAEPVDQRSVR